jgi:hypothetical protein
MKIKIFAAIADAETVRMFYDKMKIKLNYLISYYYLDGQASKVTKEYRNMIDSLYLDSGAYSAERQGINISVSEYYTYLRLYGELFDEYINLDDKFDDPEHNYVNQEIIEKELPKQARKPIPVIHNNTNPFGEFRMYADLGYDYIAMGSTTKITDDVFERIKNDYPKVKIHLFGNLNWDELIKHKPDSADAATWGIAAGNGNIYFWDDDEKKKHIVKIGNRDRNDKVPHFKEFEKREKLENFLDKKFSWNYSDLLRKWGPEKRMIVNLYFYKQMENYLNSLP